MADTINGYMETYNSGSSVTVVTGANNSHRLTINHPDTDDVTDLFYVDEYFEATSAGELGAGDPSTTSTRRGSASDGASCAAGTAA